jgi:hypothetical protein
MEAAMAVSLLATDCRTPALSALGLPEGACLAVKWKTDQSKRVLGTLHGDKIRLGPDADGNFKDVTPLAFLEKAGYTRRVTKVYEKIHAIDANNITLADRAEGRWEKDVSQSQRIAKLLSDKWGATTLGDFEAWCKVGFVKLFSNHGAHIAAWLWKMRVADWCVVILTYLRMAVDTLICCRRSH